MVTTKEQNIFTNMDNLKDLLTRSYFVHSKICLEGGSKAKKGNSVLVCVFLV